MQYLTDFLFRCLPSGLLVFLFIEANLTSKYNKYLQISAGIVVYYVIGLIGQYFNKNYNIASVDILLFFALLICYCIFFHRDSFGFKLFISILTILIMVASDLIFALVIFLLFPNLDFQIEHTTIPAYVAISVEYFLIGIISYVVYLIINKFRFGQSINKKALIFIFFPVSQFLILGVLAKVLMYNPELITVEIIMLVAVCV